MDLKHIRTFAAVARVGNLTRAAEHLHLTQPALSLQLKSFQEALDLPLFTRTAQGLAPNADGRALLPSAQRVLDALEDFERAIGALRTTVQGELRLGTILDPEFLRLGATLQYRCSTIPRSAPPCATACPARSAAVRAGELDVGFPRPARRGPWPAGAARPAAGGLFLLRGGAQGLGPQLAGRDWRDIAALPWIWTPPDSVHHRLLAAKFAGLGVTPNTVAEVDQEASMLDWCVPASG